MSITGPAEGPPAKAGVAVVDLTTGMMAANAILAALYARERSGAGQHIDISLLETQLAWLANVASGYLLTGEAPTRHGNAHPTIVPYQTFRASDTEFALGVGNDAQWRRLCVAIGRPELAEDPRFSTNPDRIERRAELTDLLAAHFATAPAADWVTRIRADGIPVGPVRTIPEVLEDPQVQARGMVVSMEHPAIGELRLVGIPFKFSATPASIRRPPPLLGEHTAEVEREYGMETTPAPATPSR
jgi:crotonobetainyl-CoA:carnitine CoA-transferase CaiB-like acyl-CoA transferase